MLKAQEIISLGIKLQCNFSRRVAKTQRKERKGIYRLLRHFFYERGQYFPLTFNSIITKSANLPPNLILPHRNLLRVLPLRLCDSAGDSLKLKAQSRRIIIIELRIQHRYSLS